ncbi:type II toxin-antitoxin system RelB/DinJ family antitoxin [Synergistaceae bacterium OttesenSCG-928-I11]|nr:type II toxin-antitoxin system RelB/DinJ family antitoxin [Synergistaceae bacterium OttesenSCG-928-I11]
MTIREHHTAREGDSVPVQIKIPRKLKQDADELFKSMGTNTSAVIRMCLTLSVAERRVPFELAEPRDINGFTPSQVRRLMRGIEQLEAGKGQIHDLIDAD